MTFAERDVTREKKAMQKAGVYMVHFIRDYARNQPNPFLPHPTEVVGKVR